jgi:hypothetical protein
MCEGEYGDDKRTCAGRSKLPPKLWLIDSVLKRNVCPLGHKTQRIGDALVVLYAFHQKFWVNVPLLIWRQIYKCWDDVIDKRLSNATTWALPFPCLITKILIEKCVPFPASVVLDDKIPIFGLATRNQSVSHMPRIVEPPEDMNVENAPAAAMDEGDPFAPRRAPVPPAPIHFALFQEQLDRVERDIRGLRDTQTAMMVMLRELQWRTFQHRIRKDFGY